MYFFVKNIEFDSFNEVINDISLKILEHGHLYAGEDWKFYGLSSPFNRLYFMISGSAVIKDDNYSVELQKGNVYLVPLYKTYDYVCDSKLHMFYIHFRVELFPGHDLFEDITGCASLPMDLKLIKELVSSAENGQINDLIKCKGIFLANIARFLKPHAGKLGEQIRLTSKYAGVYEYIKNNCFADLRIKNIANHFNIPVSNLSKNFKNDTGLTLKKYIDDKLVQKAQEKLLATDLAVKDIAYELKFLDEFHFSRFFKKRVGISPNHYRQRNNTYK